ncbi:hypothetical protein ACSVDM_13915 [Nocardia sp. JW2]|uniref:hypothetical protein n=1 Tax=Nocardia sp. JW2 TaxID=3450738 RepID=UPI003F42BFD8
MTGQAEPTVGVADPTLDTTTTQLPTVGDCTRIDEFVHHGPITVMDCADPQVNKQVRVLEIASGEEGRNVVCEDKEVRLIITGLKDGSLAVAHGCAGPHLTVGRCYVPMMTIYSHDATCTEPTSFRLDRTLPGVNNVAACDPPLATDDYAGQINYIPAKINNFIDKRTGIAYCFRQK